MTTRQRRDKGIKGASVITGLRLEKDTAQRLCDQAKTDSAGDVAELARYYIRTGLGAKAHEANRLEAEEHHVNSGLAGLRLDTRTIVVLEAAIEQHGMRKAALARHLIRRGLGISHKESMKREAGFAALADVYQGRGATFHGAGE